MLRNKLFFVFKMILFLICPFFVASCDLFVSFFDGYEDIKNAPGFLFFDSGGDGKMIIKKDKYGKKMILVDARVNNFFVKNNRLYVSRSPRVLQKNSSGSLVGYVSAECEILSIDIKTGVIQKESTHIHGLVCPQSQRMTKDWILRPSL